MQYIQFPHLFTPYSKVKICVGYICGLVLTCKTDVVILPPFFLPLVFFVFFYFNRTFRFNLFVFLHLEHLWFRILHFKGLSRLLSWRHGEKKKKEFLGKSTTGLKKTTQTDKHWQVFSSKDLFTLIHMKVEGCFIFFFKHKLTTLEICNLPYILNWYLSQWQVIK